MIHAYRTRWMFFGLAGALAVAGCRMPQPTVPLSGTSVTQARPSRVAKLAPDFTFTTLAGKAITLSELRGRPVVINFWASWCPPCRRELPALEKVYRQYSAQGLQLLGVAVGDEEPAVRRLVQEMRLSYPIGLSDEAGSNYAVSAIPHTFFLDRQGKIVAQRVGGLSEGEFRRQVEALLKKS